MSIDRITHVADDYICLDVRMVCTGRSGVAVGTLLEGNITETVVHRGTECVVMRIASGEEWCFFVSNAVRDELLRHPTRRVVMKSTGHRVTRVPKGILHTLPR